MEIFREKEYAAAAAARGTGGRPTWKQEADAEQLLEEAASRLVDLTEEQIVAVGDA